LRTIRAKDNEDTIQVQDLSKSFDNRLVVRSLSFKAPDGQEMSLFVYVDERVIDWLTALIVWTRKSQHQTRFSAPSLGQ
jgi:hypothetical protein